MSDPRATYRTLVRWQISKIGIALGVLVLFVGVAASLGVKNPSVVHVFRIVLDQLTSVQLFPDIPKIERSIILHLRLPRIALGATGGAALGIAGVVMQGIMRNPLVSPFTIGISPAAAFWASVAVLLGLDLVPGGSYLLVVFAFVAALVCAAMVLAIASIRGAQSTTLILAGIALTYLFGALTNTTQFIATEDQLSVIVH